MLNISGLASAFAKWREEEEKKKTDAQASASTHSSEQTPAPSDQYSPFQRWSTYIDSLGTRDNEVTGKVRNWLAPDAQAMRQSAMDTQRRLDKNGPIKSPYAQGTMLDDLYNSARTGTPLSFGARSAIERMENWSAFVDMGLNDADVAVAARNAAYNNANDAIARGKADAPYKYNLYTGRNAGKGYSAFGGNAGEVDKFGLSYENVRAAEVTKLNRKEGRKDSKETLLAGDYASLSDEYIDEMIPKIGDYVAGLDTNIDSGTLYDQEFFQRLNAAEFMGDAYASEDLYDYAKAMFPDREWSADDFGANGDPDKIAMVTDAVNADIADLRAGKASKVLNAYDAIKGERMTAQKLLDELRLEKENRAALAGFSERYAQGNSSADWGSMVGVDEKGTDIVDKMLYMNLMAKGRDSWDNEDDPAYQEAMAAFGGHQAYNDYSDEGYHLMTADEISLVNKVWNTTHDPVKTQEVLDAMASTLRTRRMSFDENLWAYRSDAYGDLVTDLASIPMQGYANLEGAVNAFQGMLGNKDVKDVNSGEWRTQGAVNAIRGWTGEKAYNSGGAWAKFLHDTGLAIGDEALKFLPSLAFGPGTQQALSAIAGFSQGTYGAYERGVDNPFVAAAEGATSAGIEALTENLGLDVPNTSAVRGSRHLLRNMAAEGLEEGVSEVLGQIAGEAIADLTGTYSANDLAYMDELMNSKETDRTKRHLAAQRAVADQNMEDVLYSTAVGGAVGGALSAPSAAGVSRQQRRRGSTISRNNNAGALLEVAMSMTEGSEARQMAETFSEQDKKGKKLSNGQLGRLYAATAMDLDAQSAAVVTETMNDAIVEQMVDKGETEEVARRAAPILAKQLRGETLTKEDTKVLAQSEHGITMMEELNQYSQGGEEDGPKTGLFKRTAKGTQVTNEQIQEAENLLLEKGDSAKAAKRAAPLLARAVNGDTLTKAEQAELAQIPGGEETVAQLRDAETQRKEMLKPAWVKDAESSQQAKEQQRATNIISKGQALLKTTMPSSNTAIQKSAKKAKTLTVKSDAETGVRNTSATPLGSKESVDIQRVEAGEDGVLRLQVKTADGSQKSMSYQQLSFKSESMGHVITHAIDNAAGNAELANLMVQGYTGGDSTEYLAQFDAAYRAGYDNAAVNVQSMTSFSKGISKEAFKLGQKQAQEAEQTRLKNIGKAKVGKGRVTIPASVNETKLSKQQRNQVSIVRRIADATGINFTFFESQADATGMYKAENGSYDSSTNSIRLDLNAGKNFKGDIAEYAIVRTAAHEMTHFIEANSRENYAKMRQFIADELARKGLNFNSLVQAKIDRSPVPLTRGGAIAEVVADGCEMMLKDSEAIQRLMQKDASLGQQIKNVLKEFVGRIRKAFEGIRPDSIEAKALMDEVDGVLKYADELQKMWDAGLEEAVEATRGAPGAFVAAHPKAEQFAVRDLSRSLNLRMEVISDGVESAPFRLLDNNGNEVTKFTPEMMRNTPMGTLIDAAVGAGTITEEVAQKQRKMFADLASLCAKYKENNLVWELAGAELFSAIKNNSDKQYSTTVDFGTICAKTQAIIEVMSETMLKQGRGLTRAEVIKVYNATANAGLSVPCPVCYVFSRWMGVPSLLNNMAKYQRRFTGMSAEDVTAYVNSVEARYSTKGKTVASSIAKAKTSLEAQLERVTKDLQLASARKEDTTMLEERARQLEAEYADVEAYNWVTQVYCKRRKSGKNFEQVRDNNGVLVLNENYRPVPESILFDLRRTGEFAAYPSSWLYRTTRGAGMGKAILPYSGSTIGDSVYAAQKRKSESQNAFLQQDEKGGTRAIKNAQKRAQRQNLIGGQRFQSTSDYRPEWGLDYLMTFLEMQAIGAKGQLYTKVIEAVDMFATAGIEVNLSIMPKGKGYHTDGNGNNVLAVEDFSSVTGIDFQQALEKTQKYDNVQMILVGVSDEHIRLAMADDRIGFIIPWHASGNSKDVLSQLVSAVGEVLNDSTDYTETQSDKVLTDATEAQKRARNVRTKILTKGYSKGVPDADMEIINSNKYLQRLYERFYVKGIDPEAYGVKLSSDQASQIFPHEYWDTTLTIADADENGRRFVEYCESLGIQPRFPQFAGEPGYWKLLIDRRMYNRNGTYHHPKTIDVTNVKVGDVATSVSVARYGDSVLTDKAVQEAIDRIKAETPPPAFEGIVGEAMGEHNDDTEKAEQFSLRTPAPATTRDYLLSLPDTDLTTEGQKDAMRRYKAYVDELRGLEEQRATQEELAQTTTGDAQLAAKARAGNLTKQADRLRDKLYGMENSNVFRPLAAEARAVLEANRQLDIGKPVETVIKGMGGKVRNAEEKLIRFRQQVQEDRNTREKITATRKRITKMVKYLDTLRRKESDYKHVPEELKPTVNALVAAFAEHSSMVFDSRRAERIAQAYSKLQALDNDLAAFYDPDIQEKIEYIAALMELKRGKPMKLAEVEIIEDVVGSIYKMVRGSNEAFFESQMMDIAQIAADVADEMLQMEDKRYRLNSKLEDTLNTMIVSGNLTPVYYFDNLGNSMMKRLGYDIMNGQDKYGLYQHDDRNTMGELRRQYHYNDWKNDKPIVHNDVQFTKEQVLWVYATAKREATNELAQTHHLDEGGIVFEGGEVIGADGKKRKRTIPMRLSAKDAQAITSTLTEEQKGYADAVVRHLSTTVGDRGNEVSMRMYGFRKYREQYYFPYKTASDQRHQTSVSNVVSATNDARLKHQSFSNPLKKGANTPLVIGDFTAMATSHMNAMNTYAAMVIPVENMNRVLNRKTDVDGATTTIRALMAQKYGDPTKTYLETLLKDLNGGAQVDNRTGGWIDKTVGLYKKGAVVASASVVLQQWTSIFRAAYMINPKYLTGTTFCKRDWDELVKYSGVATIKDMGRFDVSVGVGGSNWLAADADDFTLWEKARQMMKPTDWDTFKTRWDDAINFLPGYADQITWAHIWNAVKAEQAEQNPGMDTDSDAFLKQCAERFNDVINHTQVYDSTMTRSQLMRSKNALDKMMTAFGAEPTVIINMAYDATHNPAYKGKRKRMIASAIGTITLSQLFAAAMQALASAWRKDDDERKALEKFIDKWSYNFADNMNPFTMFPYVRDIWDTLFSKYEVERSDMALFSELKNAISKWNNDSYSPYRKVEEIAGTVAKFFGLPLKNVMRDFRGLYNAINSDWSSPSPTSLGYTVLDNVPLRANNAKSYYQRMENAYASGDDERAQEIASYLEGKGTSANSVNDQLGGMLKSMLAAGNDAGVDAILADMADRGKTRDSGDMRRIINDLYKNGNVSWEQAERLYKKHTTLTNANDLYWQKAELDYKGEGNYSAYRAAREALLAGDKKTYLAEKSKLLTHGKKGPNVMSETVTDLKDDLLALYETDPVEARKLREMIVWAYMECGKTKQSANKTIDGWFDDK